jgi:hypothetical protein
MCYSPVNTLYLRWVLSYLCLIIKTVYPSLHLCHVYIEIPKQSHPVVRYRHISTNVCMVKYLEMIAT